MLWVAGHGRFLVTIAALALLYFWLRGFWFAGLLVCLAYRFLVTQAWGHAWLPGILIGFAPWAFWAVIRDHQRKQNRELAAHAAATQASQVYGPEVYSMNARRFESLSLRD